MANRRPTRRDYFLALQSHHVLRDLARSAYDVVQGVTTENSGARSTLSCSVAPVPCVFPIILLQPRTLAQHEITVKVLERFASSDVMRDERMPPAFRLVPCSFQTSSRLSEVYKVVPLRYLSLQQHLHPHITSHHIPKLIPTSITQSQWSVHFIIINHTFS